MTKFEPEDVSRMRRAVELSLRGVGRVEPNPRVGAVIVDENGEIVGEGYHGRFGGPHAEIEAIARAGRATEGGTLYVTLEPCAHEGKTPPCTRAILEAGIRRVLVASRDPNPEATGGMEALRMAGIEVETGLLALESARANAPFLWWHVTGEPFVALKLAVSLDGRIARRAGARSAITGPEAGREVMRLRAASDAILIGSGTAGVDDPLLTVRDLPSRYRVPLRVVLDSGARLPATSRLARSVGEAPLLLFAAEDADPGRVARLEALGVEVDRIHRTQAGGGSASEGAQKPGLDLTEVLASLRERGCRSVLCEGGAALADALLGAGLVQRLHWHVAPRVIGPGGVAALTSPGIGDWRLSSSRPAGDDLLVAWDHARLDAVLKGV